MDLPATLIAETIDGRAEDLSNRWLGDKRLGEPMSLHPSPARGQSLGDVLRRGGENVSSREVEEAIYKLPQVSEVAVVGRPDPKWVEAVAAFIVVKQGETLSEDAVRQHCAGSMAHFKTPKRIVFVDSLPRNPSGKLLKRELRQAQIQSAPDSSVGAGQDER
jgi:acyl-CoA synthetase (AMP-forming)/AMP-acid ligase II